MSWIFNGILAAVSRYSYALNPSESPPQRGPVPKGIYEWPDDGHECDIVGESYYQDSIKSLAGPNGEYVRNKKYQAFLMLEDDNPHDSQAVRVDIEGMTVGYLGRDDARSFRCKLSAKKLDGQMTACKAWITGGRGPNGGKRSYGICLGIEGFEW